MKVTRTLVITAIGIAAGAGIPMGAEAAATNGVAACAKATSPGTWPDGSRMDGVHGLELMKMNVAKRDDFPSHDCTLPFTRAALARRRGGEWFAAAITDWNAREIEVDTSFLGDGEWRMTEFSDASDSDKFPERWARRERKIRGGEKLRVRLAPGGGWTAKFSK